MQFFKRRKNIFCINENVFFKKQVFKRQKIENENFMTTFYVFSLLRIYSPNLVIKTLCSWKAKM